MKKQLLILITLCITAIGYSQTFTDNFITYEVIPSTTNVKITDYDYTNGGATVDIPATVIFNSITYNVTEIGDEAFLAFGSSDKISSVSIPNGVTSIGYRAFQSNLLTSVTIPDSVTQIGNLSFAENSQLTSVTLSNNLTDIAQASFQSCAITSVIIPDNVISIQSSAFVNNQLTNITIPSNVTTIGVQSFKGNPLTCVISENITPPTIVTPTGPNTSTSTFFNRSNISLSIPTGTIGAYVTDAGALWTGFGSVTEVLNDTFVADNITYQILPNPNNEVTIIDYNTAGGTVVTIPASVTSSCTDFSVVSIGNNAFKSKSLTNVTIPNSITSIGEDAFRTNQFTAGITIPVGVTSIGESAFRYCQLSSVILSNTVVTIDDYAFYNNQLTSVTLPNSVTSIGDFTFEANPLVSVVSEGTTPPTVTTGAGDTFKSDRSSIDLTIPTGALGVYVTDAGALWTGFNSVTEDAALSTPNFELANDITVITTANELKVTYSNTIRLQNYAVYNMSGVRVSTGKESEIIPTNYLASGIYILKLDFDKGTFTKKIVIN